MNILAATAPNEAKDQVYNVAVGDRTTLTELYLAIKTSLESRGIQKIVEPIYRDFRVGDVRHSQADIRKAREGLDYKPEFTISEGIDQVMPWYIALLT